MIVVIEFSSTRKRVEIDVIDFSSTTKEVWLMWLIVWLETKKHVCYDCFFECDKKVLLNVFNFQIQWKTSKLVFEFSNPVKQAIWNTLKVRSKKRVRFVCLKSIQKNLWIVWAVWLNFVLFNLTMVGMCCPLLNLTRADS